MYTPHNILISRTDSIGDVILTLPVAAVLKKLFPGAQIIFLGSEYTREIVNSCEHINRFEAIDPILSATEKEQVKTIEAWNADCIIHAFPRYDIAKLAKKAGIKLRIGASGRFYHYLFCNKIVPLTRRRSELHEAQLNLKLLRPLGAKSIYSIDEIRHLFGFKMIDLEDRKITDRLVKDKFNLILHPKSKGSAREWGLDNFRKLIDLLPKETFEIFITGTHTEGELIKNQMPLFFIGVNDMTGKLTLKNLIGFIQASDGLIAASTGPLHIAAVSGKVTIGLYPPIRPMHPGRWAPVGEKAVALVNENECSACKGTNDCDCLKNIAPIEVKDKLLKMIHGSG